MAEDRGARLVGVGWSLTALAGTLMGLRIYCKIWKTRGLWWDDHLLIFSWVTLVISQCINTYIVSLGFGSHVWTISEENLKTINLNTILVACFGILSTTTGKTSFGLTLWKLTPNKYMKWLIIFILVTFNVCLNLVWIFGLAKCDPLERVWDKSVPGTCWDGTSLLKFQLFAAYYGAILDFVLAVLPWQILWKLQMKMREKIGVAVCMSLGAIAGVTGIVKAVMVVSMSSEDFTYQRVDLTIWTLAEPAVSIMAISIPVLRALYREIKSSRGGSKSNNFRDASRLTSNEPGTGNKSVLDRKSKRFGASAKYGRDMSVMSQSSWRESQEALQDSKGSESPPSGGIMKTEEYKVRMESVHSTDVESGGMELSPMSHVYTKR